MEGATAFPDTADVPRPLRCVMPAESFVCLRLGLLRRFRFAAFLTSALDAVHAGVDLFLLGVARPFLGAITHSSHRAVCERTESARRAEDWTSVGVGMEPVRRESTP